MSGNEQAILWIIGIGSLFLMSQRLFWCLASGIGALASAFATLASIIHFQILAALGFFFLAGILGFICTLTQKD